MSPEIDVIFVDFSKKKPSSFTKWDTNYIATSEPFELPAGYSGQSLGLHLKSLNK